MRKGVVPAIAIAGATGVLFRLFEMRRVALLLIPTAEISCDG